MRRLFHLVYAPYAALMLALLIPPVCVAVIASRSLETRRNVGRIGARLMLAAIGVPLRVRGTEHLPAGANIVVCNHASYIDGMVMTAALPPHYSFVVQDGAERWPLIGRCLNAMGVIFVNRREARAGARTTRELMRRLHGGEALTIFAEGTFKPEPGLLPFKAGAFLMAARCGVPVVPAAIRGSRRLFGGGRRLPRWSALHIEIAPPLKADGSEREAALALRDVVRREVLRLSGEADHVTALADRGDSEL
ncbi:lysophospholipid acyltransferase family protein [Solimonas soli]|uniref:lysophospholipid acyltransferase family protein n=1 Tax=Solimonas soli TaxID=413479 RepID=UPI00047F6121|nr:lysophospholipid acyltransferase family protein [Solimonas soli]